MRPPLRSRSPDAAWNSTTPSSRPTAHSHLISNANACATSVVPRSAPSITASATGRVTRPRPANEASSSAVAVALCRTAVMPRPAAKARNRSAEACASSDRSGPPNARVKPVRTMRTPQSSSATAPNSVKSSSLPAMVRRGCLPGSPGRRPNPAGTDSPSLGRSPGQGNDFSPPANEETLPIAARHPRPGTPFELHAGSG